MLSCSRNWKGKRRANLLVFSISKVKRNSEASIVADGGEMCADRTVIAATRIDCLSGGSEAALLGRCKGSPKRLRLDSFKRLEILEAVAEAASRI